MPIERDFLDGEGSLPIFFRVSESFEVWDGQVALVIDHLLNHLKVLTGLAEGPADQSVIDILAKDPRYAMDRKGFLPGASRETVAETLIEECTELMECLVTIAPIMDIDQKERSEVLDAAKTRIPFLDYRYSGEAHTSDALREERPNS